MFQSDSSPFQSFLQRPQPSEHEAIFLNQHGQPLTANGIEWLLRRYGQAAGIEATPHRLCHTYARQLIEGGMPLTSLGKLLGHAQVSTTEIYTAKADPELAQVYQAAMARLASTSLSPEKVLTAPPQQGPSPAPSLSVSPSLPPGRSLGLVARSG